MSRKKQIPTAAEFAAMQAFQQTAIVHAENMTPEAWVWFWQFAAANAKAREAKLMSDATTDLLDACKLALDAIEQQRAKDEPIPAAQWATESVLRAAIKKAEEGPADPPPADAAE